MGCANGRDSAHLVFTLLDEVVDVLFAGARA